MFRTINRILSLAGKYRPQVTSAIVFSLLHAVFSALDILAVLHVLVHVSEISTAVIIQALIILLVALAGKFFCKWKITSKIGAAGYDIFTDKRISVGQQLKRASMGYFSSQNLGAIHTAVTSGMNDLEAMSMMVVENVLGGIIYSAVCVVYLLFFDWRIALVTLIGLLVGVGILSLVQKSADSVSEQQLNAREKMVGSVLEYVQGIATARLFDCGKDSRFQIKPVFREKKNADLRAEQKILWPSSLFRYVFRLASCVVIGLSAIFYVNGTMSLTYSLMFLFASFLIYARVDGMAETTAVMRIINTALNQFEVVLNIPTQKGNQDLDEKKNLDIEMQDVSFGYGGSRKVIDHVSAKIPEGSVTAIVGPSGGGKTTICNLIARFWDVDEGRILLGGQDVRTLKSESLLSKISMVFQNVYLFNDTVENNIRFGKPDATHAEVVAAAKKARCDEFISELPDGYNTMVGEGGSTLSGGERQRISIARAILKDAPIVILDEATSSVDPENEHALVQAINELTRNKTLITIAHRLSTVREADQILVVEKGRIVQRGTHDELAAEPGIYQNFLNIRQEAEHWKL